MGGFKMNTKSRNYLAQKLNQTIRTELNPGEEIEISMLINSVHYFVDCAFIARLKNKYHLVAFFHSQVLFDKYYPTERGCRNAFQKMFKGKAWSEEVKADWTHYYPPDRDWLEEKQSYLENNQEKSRP
jgi:hypothetical protein